VVLALWTNLRERAQLERTLAILSLAFAVTTVASFWLMQRIPFDPFSLLADRRQLIFMPLYYVVTATPFFFSGLVLALLFTRGAREINRLYAFDLLGAGLGCAAIALVMPAFGGSGSVVVAAVIGSLAAIIFSFSKMRPLAAIGIVVVAGLLALAFVADRVLPITVTPNKRRPPQEPIYTAWNTFSRIDVYETQAPASGKIPAGLRRVIIIDGGTASTALRDMRPGVRDYLSRVTDDSYYDSGIAYLGKQNPRVLIIGSGAGLQVLDALHFGASSITAVEINPITNDLVSRRMRDFWGGLFEQPEVLLVTEDGRSFVRRSQQQYDSIISVLTISNAALASGALSLAENYVFTREAFEDYLDHLTPDGVLYFTRPETQIPRLFATAREVFDRRGLGSVAGHVYAFRWLPAPPQPGQPALPQAIVAGFLLKKSPFTPDELQKMSKRLGTTQIETLYSPLEQRPGTIYHQLATASNVQTVYAETADELSPATDDRPFFNQHARWSSLRLGTFRDVFTQEKQARFALENRPVAEVTLLTLLVQATFVSAILILLPLLRYSRRGLKRPGSWSFLTYFAGLGLGFIMIEIALLQRFTLFLGQPVYTFAVILASLLIFTGVGAYIADRLRSAPRRNLLWVIPGILVVVSMTAVITPFIFSTTLGWVLPWRIGISVLLVGPLGIILGMPFPTGLRVIAEEAPILIPWAWGVNGFFTVIGSVGALIFGMAFGFRVVLLIAGGCYLAALAAIIMIRQNQLSDIALPGSKVMPEAKTVSEA
jgi:MFS family permease